MIKVIFFYIYLVLITSCVTSSDFSEEAILQRFKLNGYDLENINIIKEGDCFDIHILDEMSGKEIPKLNDKRIQSLVIESSKLTGPKNINLETLKILEITSSELKDINLLRNASVSEILMTDVELTNIDFIQEMRNLKSLQLSSVPLEKLPNLSGSGLEELVISYVGVDDLNPIKNNKLFKLYLEETNAIDLSPLKESYHL